MADNVVGALSMLLSLGSRAVTDIPSLRRWYIGTREDGADLNLPPVAQLGDLAHALYKHGLWRRHLIDRELADRHGHLYAMLPPKGMGRGAVKLAVTMSEPELVRQVLRDTATFPTRGRTGLSDTVAGGLVELPTGPRHAFHRRIIGSLLTDSHLREYASTVEAETKVMLGLWAVASAKGAVVNAHYDLTVLTEDIIGVIGLGQRFEMQSLTEEENSVASDRAFMLRRAMISTVAGARGLRRISSRAAVARERRIRAFGHARASATVDAALNTPAAASRNMISALKAATDVDGAKLTAQEVRDEFITIQGAGHETTSNTLSWVLMLLAQHPNEQRRLHAEVAASVPGQTCTFEEAEKLDFAKMVVFEALRLYPTVPSFPRLSVKETRLGGYDLPAGTLVFVSQAAMNRRVDLWGEDAAEFRPSRFDKEGYSLELVQSQPKGCPEGPLYGFAPFGAGKRTCPGQRLAMMEAVVILASIVKHFRLELAHPSRKVDERADITLGPKKGLPLKLVARSTPDVVAGLAEYAPGCRASKL